MNNASSPLFDRFPELRERLPWTPIARYPSPVAPLPPPPGAPDCRLFIKRDDQLSSLYGGNKVRKLEHLLADAQRSGCRSLITVGALGSHHCLATALHGRSLGFHVDLCLSDQPVTDHVLEVLNADLEAGAHLEYGGGYLGTAAAVARRWVRRRREGLRPRYIPLGATSPLGNVGFVTAGLELALQIEAGEMPMPDRIFVAAGSVGTVAGLLVGLRLAGLPTRIVAVKVASAVVVNRPYIQRLVAQTVRLLERLLPYRLLPYRLNISRGSPDLEIEPGFFGGGYGSVTTSALEAIRWAAPIVQLETTYTAKALAAMLAYARGEGRGQTLLFWNTFGPVPANIPVDLGRLPVALREVVSMRRGM